MKYLAWRFIRSFLWITSKNTSNTKKKADIHAICKESSFHMRSEKNVMDNGLDRFHTKEYNMQIYCQYNANKTWMILKRVKGCNITYMTYQFKLLRSIHNKVKDRLMRKMDRIRHSRLFSWKMTNWWFDSEIHAYVNHQHAKIMQ